MEATFVINVNPDRLDRLLNSSLVGLCTPRKSVNILHQSVIHIAYLTYYDDVEDEGLDCIKSTLFISSTFITFDTTWM